MRTKDIIALVLIALLVLAGCTPTPADNAAADTSAPTSGASEQDEPQTSEDDTTSDDSLVTFSFLKMTPASTTIDPWKDTPVGKLLAERTGVNLEIEFIVGTDVRQKAALLNAAGDYPDIMQTGDASGDFYSADAFVPLEGYLDTLPNLGACFTESQKKLMTQEDGHIYWLGPHPSENAVHPAAGYYLSMELLKQNDYPVVTDFQVWQDMIIDYVKNNPTINDQPTIGISEPTATWRASAVQYGGSRFLVGYQNDGLTVVDPDTLECKIIMDQDFQKQFVYMMFRMWNEGVADTEMFMQTDEQYQAKIGTGRIAGLYDQRGMIQVGLDALKLNAPEHYLVAFPVVLPGVTTERYRGPRNFSGGSGVGITVSCKDPDRAAKFFDDMSKEENQITSRWGIEGEDFAFNDNGGLTKTEQQWKDYSSTEHKQARGINQVDFFHFFPNLDTFPVSGTIASPENTPEYAELAYTDFETEFLSHYADRGYTTFVDWFKPSYPAMYEPGWSIRQRIDTADPRKVAGETALEITLEYIPKLVQAGTDDNFNKIWDEFTGVLGELPLREYEQLVNEMLKESAPLYK